MNYSKEFLRSYHHKTGLTLKALSEDEFERIWFSKGEVYRHALMKVREVDPIAIMPALVKETFPSALLDLLEFCTTVEEEGQDEGLEAARKGMRSDFRLNPDLYSIDRDKKEVRLHEIEDTHPMEPLKLARVLEAFGWCDQTSVNLRLFVYDRYGFTQREIDLPMLEFTKYCKADGLFYSAFPGVKEAAHQNLGVPVLREKGL